MPALVAANNPVIGTTCVMQTVNLPANPVLVAYVYCLGLPTTPIANVQGVPTAAPRMNLLGAGTDVIVTGAFPPYYDGSLGINIPNVPGARLQLQAAVITADQTTLDLRHMSHAA